MLGIRFSPEDELELGRLAREAGRPKSVLARDWIKDRMSREAINQKIRNAASLDADERKRVIEIAGGDATDAWMRYLDAEDGGYNWGPSGPPA